MTDDIVKRLGCALVSHGSAEQSCGECAYCLAAAEIERLRAVLDAVDVVLAEVGNHHRPNSDGRGCWWCGPGDGSWPCVHRMVLDELKEARRG